MYGHSYEILSPEIYIDKKKSADSGESGAYGESGYSGDAVGSCKLGFAVGVFAIPANLVFLVNLVILVNQAILVNLVILVNLMILKIWRTWQFW